jgi:hypothetical protein
MSACAYFPVLASPISPSIARLLCSIVPLQRFPSRVCDSSRTSIQRCAARHVPNRWRSSLDPRARAKGPLWLISRPPALCVDDEDRDLLRALPSTREVISAKTSRMFGATISASEGMLFKPSGYVDRLRQHSFTTIGTEIGRCQAEAKFPGLEEQIHTLAERGTSRQIHPSGFHRLMKFPRCFIDDGRSLFPRVRRPFEVKANSGALFFKHGANYSFQMDEPITPSRAGGLRGNRHRRL